MTQDVSRILLVEDDARVRAEIVDGLRAHSHSVTPASTVREARFFMQNDFDIVLLDLNLPDGDGLDFCRQQRAAGNDTPVLILTARGSPAQRVRGFDVGADDYVVKPVHVPELIGRIRSILRRNARFSADTVISIGAVAINCMTRSLRLRDNPVSLKPREFDLLAHLMKHPGRAFTRERLLAEVWGHDFYGSDRTIDLHIARLRSAIESNPRCPEYIETIWGHGYRFREDV